MAPVLRLLFLLVTSSVAVSARPARCHGTNRVGRVIYTITNDKANSVVAVPISSNGMLSGGTSISTGGAGSNFFDGTTNGPAAPDALASQSALTIAGTNLFAVNAGSNTMTMFAIDQSDPTKLTMVGQPVAVPGEFPNTVAASQKNNLVCVGSSGAKSGISCAKFSENGVGAMDMLRSVDLNQTTPPAGPTNTISQAFFSNDESTLLATVKGDPDKMKTGFLAAYQVESGGGGTSVSQSGMRSSPNGTAVLFGSSTIPNTNNIFATDASFGGAVLSLDKQTNVASVKGMAAVDGQKATCWVAISPATNTAFVTDVGTNRLVEMSLTDASIKSTLDLTANGDPGLTDLKAAGKFVYALSPGNGTTQPAITVVDAVGKKQVQHFGLQQLGVGKNAQGMALLL
ncbi:3-carboxymuconate cyclase [Colletotrichum tofieldiae]|uniref:3-carboxymuconate cyclase n=1 Tax=Colletotrichum tofieldiae TaxID=708197 RepID=A0A166NXQ0_9PEZI|nr:3-carboxymuconate cyclase [Colletotrichum tofieldiae]GKT52679.1 3-carboxymuconate cyclase [Colletotrichum tofieldiae]